MKKKIINGFLMVALLAATVTSFVSCKDNDEDVKTDLIAQIQAQKTALTDAYKTADATLKSEIESELAKKATQADLNDFKTLVASTYVTNAALDTKLDEYAKKEYVDNKTKEIWDYLNKADDPNSVANKITAAETAIEELQQNGATKEDIEKINEELKKINEKLEDLQAQIDDLKYAIENLITSVNVNATETNIPAVADIIMLGKNVKFLGAIYGKAKRYVEFPNVDANELADGVKKEAIEEGTVLFNEKKAAGTVYFTVNPSNIVASDMDKVTLSLTNSQNDESIIKLRNAYASSKVLSTRASEVTLWQADATADVEKLGKLAPSEIFDIKQAAQHVETILKDAKNAAEEVNRNNYTSVAKTATKEILKETAQTLADFFTGVNSPDLPKLALKAEWTDKVAGTRNVISDYNIAATAYKPFDFFYGQGIIEDKTVSFDKIDAAALRVINKVQAELNKFNLSGLEIKSITLSDTQKAQFDKTQTIYIWIHKTTDTAKDGDGNNVTVVTGVNIAITTENTAPDGFVAADLADSQEIKADMTKAVEELLKSVNKSLTDANSAIQDVLGQVKSTIGSANSFANRAKNLEKRVSDYLESFVNRFISQIANNGFYKALQPIMLYQGANGVNRIVSGSTFAAGKEYDLLPTTVTNELLAPAFKKYVAVVDASGKVNGKVLVNGDDDFQKYTVTFSKGQNTIIYAAMDFYGNQVVKRYTVNAE